MKPNDKLPAWKAGPALDLIEACVVMLNLHGFMTDAERVKVDARVRKWVAESTMELIQTIRDKSRK